MDTLISNVTVVTMNERMEVLFGANIAVTDGKITHIGKTLPEGQPETIVDGTGMVAIPGLINCHTHLTQTVLRSLVDDSSRTEALEQLLLRLSRLDPEGAKAAATLGIAECLRFGITSVSDLSEQPEAVAQAAAEAGIRANIAPAAQRFVYDTEEFDFETDPQCAQLRQLAQQWHGHDNGRIRIDAGIHSQYTSNHQLWEALSDYAAEAGLGMQLHLSETGEEADECVERTGLEPAQLLDCHRLFRVPTAAAGCAALSEEEQKLLGSRKVSAVLTPAQWAKSGLPAPFAPALVKAGMNVALGTGGAAEAGNADLFRAMYQTACHARRETDDPAAMPAAAALMMATVCGARAQQRADSTGMLKEGYEADIVLVDFSAPHLLPCHNVLSALVFSACGADVAMTMVGGRILYRNGQFPTLDLAQAVSRITQQVIPNLFTDPQE